MSTNELKNLIIEPAPLLCHAYQFSVIPKETDSLQIAHYTPQFDAIEHEHRARRRRCVEQLKAPDETSNPQHALVSF